MSIIIRGMTMPTECRVCSFLEFYNHTGETWCKAGNGILASGFKPIPFERRPDWCPLVDLGKHGDLIDRDEVRDSVFHHLSIKGEENLLPAEKSVFGNIIKAKAVIEAEGEE